MIISASSRTDIPAFYGAWFQNRLDDGYCLSANPFNDEVYRIGLQRHEVEGFVFWTKNIAPFLKPLSVVKKRGFPFVVQYTINGYPRALEPAVPPAETSVENLRRIAQTYGIKAAVWRYDPILITSITDFDFHRQNFARLAHALCGAVDEVVVSYTSSFYRTTQRNLDRVTRRGGFQWEEVGADRKREFLVELASIAADNGMDLSLCGQSEYLSPGVQEAVCIDARRLSEVAGRRICGWKPGHRGKRCACDYSRDIGAYDTCLHGCAYCYAVNDLRIARRFHERHNPLSEWLRVPRRTVEKKPDPQLQLFS